MACRVMNPMFRELREGGRFIVRRKKKYEDNPLNIAREILNRRRRKTNGKRKLNG